MSHPGAYLIGSGALLWRTVKPWIGNGATIHGIFHTGNEPIPPFIRSLKIKVVKTSRGDIPTIGTHTANQCVLVSINNPFILPDVVIQKFSGVYNLHNGDVRKFRGIAEVCVFAALCLNEGEYGITLQRLEPGDEVDSGRVIAQKRFPICSTDTFESLMHRSLRECEVLLHESMSLILNSSLGVEDEQISPMVYSFKDVVWIAKKALPNNLIRASYLGHFSSLLSTLLERISKLDHLIYFENNHYD